MASPGTASVVRQMAAIGNPVVQAPRRIINREAELVIARAAVTRAALARTAALQAAAAKRAATARAAAARLAAANRAAHARVADAHTDAVTHAAAPSGTPRQIAARLLAVRGWSGQFSCLDDLWNRESGWNIHAENPSSGAYGIPQALPASKMSSAGSDWQSDATTQIEWGLSYIAISYGTPCGAWDHEEAAGWY